MKRKVTCKNLFTCTFTLILGITNMTGSFAQSQQSSRDTKNSFTGSPMYLNTAGYSTIEKPTGEPGKSPYDQDISDFRTAQWTLEKCYEIALENNNTIKQEQNNIRSALLDKKIAQYKLLPAVSYNMGHYFSFGKNIDPVTNAFSFESFSGGYTALGLELDLFSGFKKINTIKEKTFFSKAAGYQKRKVILELLTDLTLTYTKLLLNKEELDHKRNVIKNTFKELEIINEKIKVGRLSKYEFYAFNAHLNTEQAELIMLQNDSTNTVQDLRQLMNISYKDKVDIASVDDVTLQNISAANYSAEIFEENILKAHPAIKLAEATESAARVQLKIAKSNFLPSVFVAGNLVSNYNTDQKDITGGKIPLSTQLNNNLGKNINIGLSIPIFSQMESVNQVRKEKINIANAQLSTENAKKSVTSDLLHLINNFNSAKESYKATLSAYEQNKLSYNLYLEKYRLGQLSSVELITAQNILNTAVSKYLESKLQLYFQFQLLELLKKSCLE